jgi:prepilin-type N-terminal cleavage/methylation domain-containing protein
MRINRSKSSAFTLVEIMIVVAIIGLLAAIAIPNLVTARKKAQRQACISTLKAIEGAKANWALDMKKGDGDVPTDADLFGADKYIETKPTCPAGGTYNIGAVRDKPTCDKPDHVLGQ